MWDQVIGYAGRSLVSTERKILLSPPVNAEPRSEKMPMPSWKEWIKKQNTREDPTNKDWEVVEKVFLADPVFFSEPNISCPDWVEKINETNLESLLEVKGIGPKTAEKIISGRPYSSTEGVPVSPVILEKLKNWSKN
jgi:hypothetical protein